MIEKSKEPEESCSLTQKLGQEGFYALLEKVIEEHKEILQRLADK